MGTSVQPLFWQFRISYMAMLITHYRQNMVNVDKGPIFNWFAT